MSSKRNVYKCRFGCSHAFKTEAGRNYHEEQMHGPWITPTTGSRLQVFTLSHVFDWSRSIVNQINAAQDKLNVDLCLE